MSALTESAEGLTRRAREALGTLAAQFLLGIGANLVGTPEENPGAAGVVAGILLGLHALVGIGLVVVAVRVWLATRRAGIAHRAGLWALIVILLTFVAGVVTMFTDSGWASFLMSVGFVAAAALYVAVGARALTQQRSAVAS
ncbi:hypothetical protein [Leifsonia sp. AG29]|uniref:hypothetical protein n=1 Tax=Leifsonia sp. AG29 TaxID=2598860 RepID=UPI00131C7E3E|nr:hypothetical protein [Leifsonia sp. AG29]